MLWCSMQSIINQPAASLYSFKYPPGVKQATRAPAALSTLAVAADAADDAADARPMLHTALMSSAALLAPVFQVPLLTQCS